MLFSTFGFFCWVHFDFSTCLLKMSINYFSAVILILTVVVKNNVAMTMAQFGMHGKWMVFSKIKRMQLLFMY